MKTLWELRAAVLQKIGRVSCVSSRALQILLHSCRTGLERNWAKGYRGILQGFRIENRMEKNVEHEMEAG